jgi:rhamnulose-1-phosphate aldolase/alcohol dehydrogenase
LTTIEHVPSGVPSEDVADLIARSRRLGSDLRVTNFAGGNTSVKTTLADPIDGTEVRVLVVKGSGGDLGTLTEAGLATLVLSRVHALERLSLPEDDVVDLYAHCMFGPGGAVPSIDTPLHAFITHDHVDHLHPDAVIALAAAADGPELVATCFGGEVGWLDWQRPGFSLGLRLRDFQRDHLEAIGAVLGGHGVICWGETSAECEARSLDIVGRAEAFIAARGSESPFGPVVTSAAAPDPAVLDPVALAPVIRGVAGSDRPVIGHFSAAPVVLDFLSRASAPRLAALGTSCPDHFLRTKVRPLFVDQLDATRIRDLHAQYRADYTAYYERHATPSSPPQRGADPAIVLLPGVGMWSFGPDAQAARVAGEFYINAINVMRGAESLSAYSPIDDAEKFRIEYWDLEERKLRMRPPAPPLEGKIALVTGAASGIGKAIAGRLSALGACVAIVDLNFEAAEKVAAEIGLEQTLPLAADVSDEAAVIAAVGAVCRRWGGIDIAVNNAGYAVAAPLVETEVDEFERLHAVLSRGSFLISREAAKVMRAQGHGGDIVYVVSKNAIAAGPANVAYSSAKADQAHQVRLLAAELGADGIRVNGVNPDGVVKGSGIFTGDWLRQRAEAYGVAPEKLGEFYASRTLLGMEVLPENVADAVAILVTGQLACTTGTLIPVDGGIAAAFLR